MIVILIGLALLAGLIYTFVKPLVDQASTFSRDLPQYVEDARDGKGPIGDIVKRYDLEQKVKDNQDKIQQAVTDFGTERPRHRAPHLLDHRRGADRDGADDPDPDRGTDAVAERARPAYPTIGSEERGFGASRSTRAAP